ncbi:transposase, IS4 family [Neisseria meningitidis NM3230]|nr:transposase, IS4 family [Neisseria meningitidis NM3230]
MSTFFQQTAQAMIAKHIDRFPLLKLDQVIDWQPIEQYLNRQRTRYLRPPRPSCLPAVVHVQSRPARTMAQPLRSRTRTQPHHPHRLQPVLPF